ncbi:MAG: hypothetical protein ABSH53_10465 [Holophaga sp.]|jgi:hypothetical protein
MGWTRTIERNVRHYLQEKGLKRVRPARQGGKSLEGRAETQLLLQANLLARAVGALPESTPIQETEFKCFSQFGEDGIIQFLVQKLKIREKVFVEFGVEDYQESNTRFLMYNNYWSGLVMDGSPRNVQRIRHSDYFFKYDLKAQAAWITRDNIDELIRSAGITGPIGLLSIDLDGNDYWVWEALTVVDPVIVICEYNNLFGPEKAVTIPYREAFTWDGCQYSGASLRALCRLGERKGYAFLGSDLAGVNAFFVRKDRLGGLHVGDPEAEFRRSCFRGGRDPRDRSRFLERSEGLEAMAERELVDLETGAVGKVRDLLAGEFRRVF